MVRAVFFDLYGTLIDIRTDEDDPQVYETLSRYLAYENVRVGAAELRDQYRSLVRAALEAGLQPHPEVDVHLIFRNLISTYAVTNRSSLAGHQVAGPVEADSLARGAAVLFRALSRRVFKVNPGVAEVLARLQTEYDLGLISNAQWVFTDPELAMTDLARFFPVAVLSSRVGVKKPDPRIFAEALRAAGVTAAESVYVGDSPERDLVGARSVGMKSILFGSEEGHGRTLRPDAWFRSYAELESTIDAVGAL